MTLLASRTTAPARDRTPPPVPPPPPLARRPVSHRVNLVKATMIVAIWAMPLLVPAGPGNTAPADVFLAAAIIIAALWFASRRYVMRFPYLVPVGLSILAGALASTVAYSGAYVSVGGGLISLIQDAFLLAWAITIANLGRDHAMLRSITKAWSISATCWAALMIIGVIAHIALLSGQSTRNGVRAQFTLGDANLAANYFICSLLVLRAAMFPRRRALRWLCCALLISAIALTGSNGGAMVLIVTTLLGGLFRMTRRRGAVPAIITASALALAVLIIAPHVKVHSTVDRAATSSQLAHDSIGRQAQSSSSRSTILAQTIELYFTGDSPIGIGPGGTKGSFHKHQYAYVKMAHDDYAAALVERGLLGGVALIFLVVIVAARCRRILARPLRREFAEVFPRPELLVAAVIGMFMSAMFYQVLHFRHLWALLGIVAAIDLWGRRERAAERPDALGAIR
jgi:O-antigen ligase